MTETIVAMAVATFLTRAIGLWGLPIRTPWVLRAVGLVPVAAFAVLVSASLEVRPGAWFRWLVVGVGGWLSWRGVPVWACVGIGLAIYFAGTALFR
jgi:branched-subunit amino acid transport protein